MGSHLAGDGAPAGCGHGAVSTRVPFRLSAISEIPPERAIRDGVRQGVAPTASPREGFGEGARPPRREVRALPAPRVSCAASGGGIGGGPALPRVIRAARAW